MTLRIDPEDKRQPRRSSPQRSASPPKSKHKKSGLFKFIGRLLSISFLITVWCGTAGIFVVLWFAKGLPDLSNLSASTRRPSITIQTYDGTVLGTYGDVYEDMLYVSDLPDYVPKALMAVEDRRFEYHFGVDVIGLVRAFYANYRAQRVVQGGSTLTQQLAKNILQSYGAFKIEDRSIKRKVQEVIIALWLEWKFTKSQIMTMYLNRVCFGGSIYGVDAAARTYFNKSARQLTVFEAALLAGLLKAPSRYSPTHNVKKSIQRATVVLKLMEEAGFIRDYKSYVKQGEGDLANIRMSHGKEARYFADWVYENLPNYIGTIDKDLVVITTLDMSLQKHSEMMTRHYIDTMGNELKSNQIGPGCSFLQ